jgi:16S rRNA (adenine1518-N6/adenine1519-N6)-dimethyltransferase
MDTMLHPVIASREVTRYILETFGLRAKKKFGQNFLINEKVVRGIAEYAQVGPGDLVLEIGPGIGTLTQALAETGARVKSVEIDRSLLPVLARTLEGTRMWRSCPGTS